MKWMDDLKKKATEDAGKAAANALMDQAQKRVESFAEGLLGDAEKALADARASRGLDDEAPVDEAADVADAEEPEVEASEPEEPERSSLDQALEELQRRKLEAAAEAAARTPAPVIEDDGYRFDAAPAPARRPDPYDAAEAALARAAEARGADPDAVAPLPRSPSRDPLGDANAALERAREARRTSNPRAFERAEAASRQAAPPPVQEDPMARAERLLREAAEARANAKVSPRVRAREEAARKELERLKAGTTRTWSRDDEDADEADEPAPTAPGPRKRRL